MKQLFSIRNRFYLTRVKYDASANMPIFLNQCGNMGGKSLIALLPLLATVNLVAAGVNKVHEQYTTPGTPVVIDQSAKHISCPEGYQELGKQCARTVYVEPQITCPNGGQLTAAGNCVKYLGKNSECLPGFNRVGGLCIRIRSAPRELVCPEGYLLRTDDECVRTVTLPDHEACPAGSTVRGETCVIQHESAPVIECPEGFNLVEKECIREEAFDCTPRSGIPNPMSLVGKELEPELPTSGELGATEIPIVEVPEPSSTLPPEELPPTITFSTTSLVSPTPIPSTVTSSRGAGGEVVSIASGQNHYFTNGKGARRRLQGIGHVSTTTSVSQIGHYPNNNRLVRTSTTSIYNPQATTVTHPQATTVTHPLRTATVDYVVESTCKRMRVQPADKVCPNGALEGKMCQSEQVVAPVIVPGGIVEELAAPYTTCPAGYSADLTNPDLCTVEDEVTPTFYCPAGSVDEGERCAVRSPSRATCDAGFALEGDVCAETEFVQPLVEFTVTYACVGKECE